MEPLNYTDEQRQRMRDSSFLLFVGLEWAIRRYGDCELNKYDRENVEFLEKALREVRYGKTETTA